MNDNFNKDLPPRTYSERYKNYLAPELNFSPWTLNEDILLMQLHNILGNHWHNIAKYFNHRSILSLKSRYRFVKSHRTSEEELENYLSGSKPISIYKKIPAAKKKSDSESIPRKDNKFVIPEINGINP